MCRPWENLCRAMTPAAGSASAHLQPHRAAIIDKLNNEINAIVGEPDTRGRLVGLGVRPLSMTSAQFGKLIGDDTEKWAKVVRSANIKAE